MYQNPRGAEEAQGGPGLAGSRHFSCHRCESCRRRQSTLAGQTHVLILGGTPGGWALCYAISQATPWSKFFISPILQRRASSRGERRSHGPAGEPQRQSLHGGLTARRLARRGQGGEAPSKSGGPGSCEGPALRSRELLSAPLPTRNTKRIYSSCHRLAPPSHRARTR